MKAKKTICIAAAIAMAFGLATNPVSAETKKVNVLVVDSGSDFEHKALKPVANPNKAEFSGKANVDDDKNGYVDDVYGWNFVENNNVLVNLQDTPPEYEKVLKVMEYLGRLQANGKEDFTAQEWNWLAKNYNDPKLQPWVSFCGGWAHGTHCAGIIGLNNQNVKMNAVRHIQTGTAPHFAKKALEQLKFKLASRGRSAADEKEIEMLHRNLFAKLSSEFSELGKQYAKETQAQAKYLGTFNPRLINCSFGTENSGLVNMMRANMRAWGFVNPSKEEVQYVVNEFVDKALLPRDKALFSSCKNALIFIAAGNSSENLDEFVSSPGDMHVSNKIVIAATDRDMKLADFSCYGKRAVDVAVPGVNIYATYPNQAMGYMSGTSMACPNALRMASSVLAVNPDLTPVQLKQILMKTVDKKSWLKGVVKSGGVINERRAVAAGKLVKEGRTVTEACKEARKRVPDVLNRLRPTKIDFSDPLVKEMYFKNVF